MNRIKLITVGAFALSALALGACKGGPEGKYSLDKTEMKKAMAARVAKLPPDQQAAAGFASALVDSMEVSLELKAGGQLEMNSSMPGMGGAAEKKTESGTWKKDGDKVILTTKGKDVSCDSNGKSLTCQGDKPDEPAMVFVKAG